MTFILPSQLSLTDSTTEYLHYVLLCQAFWLVSKCFFPNCHISVCISDIFQELTASAWQCQTHPRFWVVRGLFFVCEFVFFFCQLSEFYLASAVLLHCIKGSLHLHLYHQLWVLKIPTRIHFDIHGFLYSRCLSASCLLDHTLFKG